MAGTSESTDISGSPSPATAAAPGAPPAAARRRPSTTVIPASPFTYTIPNNYLTSRFRIRFYLDGFSQVTASTPTSTISRYRSPTPTGPAGADWSVSSGQFAGHHSSGDRYLTRSANIDLSAYAGKTVTISWAQSEGGDLGSGDILRFSISKDGGSTWSASGSSRRRPSTMITPPAPFTYTIPNDYLTSSFKIRFYLDGV